MSASIEKTKVVPLMAQWSLINGNVCTPDGGLLYIGVRSINYIGPSPISNDSAAAEQKFIEPVIRIFHTRQAILSVDVDPYWSCDSNSVNCGGADGNGTRLFAILSQDHSVQVWDFDKGCAIRGHKAHCDRMQLMDGHRSGQQPGQVLISYMINRNILSIDQRELVVYCVASNCYYRQSLFVPVRGHNHQITTLKCSPYNENHFALGTNRGLVLICNLLQMTTLYTLRGHDASIISLAWNKVCVKAANSRKKSSAESLSSLDSEPLQRSKHYEYKQQGEIVSSPEMKQKHMNNNDSMQSTVVNLSTDILDDDKAERENPDTETKSNKSYEVDVNNSSMAMDDPFDIYACNYAEQEFGVLCDDQIPKRNDYLNQSTDELKLDKISSVTCSSSEVKFDFIEACENLKHDIIASKSNDEMGKDYGREPGSCSPDENIVTLEDCQRKVGFSQKRKDSFSCNLDDDGDEQQAFVIVKGTDEKTEPSKDNHSDDSFCDTNDISKDAKFVAKKLLYQAEVHMVQTPELFDDETSSCKQEHFEDILLISVGIDGNIWLWNTELGSACDHQRLRNSKKGKSTQIEAHWLSSDTVVANNSTGELFYWRVQKMPSSLPTSSAVAKEDLSYKLVELKTRKSPLQTSRNVVSHQTHLNFQWHWCITANREIQLEDNIRRKILLQLSCISSNIATMAECPDDMNKIALGMSDRRLGIIDLSKMGKNNLFIENYTQRIDSQILALSWNKDGRKIAYGTVEGRVGIINMELSNKLTPITFNPICGKPIYSISWHDSYLFIVCNERIAAYEVANPRKDAQFICEISGVSTISVRGEFLFVGTQKGHFKLYKNEGNNSIDKLKYVLIETLELFSRYVTMIDWNLLQSSRLAVASNANSVCVLEFDKVSEKLTLQHRLNVKSTKSTNAWVKWSSSNVDQLLTCGADGVVRVWQLFTSSKPREIFQQQFHCPMNCGLFLPSDQKVLICSGRNTTLEFINVRVMDAGEIKSSWKHLHIRTLDNIQWASKVVTDLDKPNNNAARNKLNKMNKSSASLGDNAMEKQRSSDEEELSEVTNESYNLNNEGEAAVSANPEEIINLLEGVKLNATTAKTENHDLRNTFMKKPTTLLYLITKDLHKEALNLIVERLDEINEGRNSTEYNYKSLCMQLFGTRKQAKALLATEISRNERHNATKGIADIFLPQLNVSLKETILKYAQAKQLCEWHVSLAPSISYSFWEKCCETFAEQLMEEGYGLQAASYMLAIHRQESAIEMLRKGHFYKEALLLARIYLQPDDPIESQIITEWTKHYENNGNLTSAALIYVLSNRLEQARDCLSKMRNLTSEVENVLELLNLTIKRSDSCNEDKKNIIVYNSDDDLVH